MPPIPQRCLLRCALQPHPARRCAERANGGTAGYCAHTRLRLTPTSTATPRLFSYAIKRGLTRASCARRAEPLAEGGATCMVSCRLPPSARSVTGRHMTPIPRYTYRHIHTLFLPATFRARVLTYRARKLCRALTRAERTAVATWRRVPALYRWQTFLNVRRWYGVFRA